MTMGTKVQNIIHLKDVKKQFQSGENTFSALRLTNLSIAKGEFISIVGKSGSGKSTLLNLLSGIDQPSSGQINVAATAIHNLSNSALDRWRGQAIGMVFQFFQLIPTLTVLENVLLPMDFCKTIPAKQRQQRALDLLKDVQLEDKADKFPSILSGGEQQRVAIARALANDPPIILGDEPTGNLDTQTARCIYELFQRLNEQGKTIVLVSHDPICQNYSQRSIHIRDGVLGEGRDNA
ncbi:MAG: putative ABC transport system ATP-binding protein [Flavobacteriales bacterium]|jgi:putative ABC transport system ATP-binding protein